MSSPATPELMVVMPVYNEQASIKKVVTEWFSELENWVENFTFLIIDDGSRDNTIGILSKLKLLYGDRLEILTRENRGHGQSCLQGYQIACDRGVPYVFQIDSDGQCDPQYFFRFWRARENFDVIYGFRKSRDDGFRRVIASIVLKMTLLLSQGVHCIDSNVPYRLMKTRAIAPFISKIPRTFFLANVGLAVLLRKHPDIKQGQVRIHFRERYGGEPSVAFAKFGTKAFELVKQLNALK